MALATSGLQYRLQVRVARIEAVRWAVECDRHRSIACGIVLLVCWTGEVWAGQHVFIGRRLDTALLLLQRDGLPIVFSSEIVTPDMHVTAGPRPTTAVQQLDDQLTPHGLKAEAGPR